MFTESHQIQPQLNSHSKSKYLLTPLREICFEDKGLPGVMGLQPLQHYTDPTAADSSSCRLCVLRRRILTLDI